MKKGRMRVFPPFLCNNKDSSASFVVLARSTHSKIKLSDKLQQIPNTPNLPNHKLKIGRIKVFTSLASFLAFCLFRGNGIPVSKDQTCFFQRTVLLNSTIFSVPTRGWAAGGILLRVRSCFSFFCQRSTTVDCKF